jgi:FkbM family methyltransferase
MNLDDWSVIPGDKALKSALEKEKRQQNNQNLSIVDYQRKNLDAAMRFVKNFTTVIDAGANYGVMSYNLNTRFDYVHAFEVEPEVRECLKRNVEKFKLHKVQVHDCGLSNKEESVSVNYLKNTFGTYINKKTPGSFICKTIDSFNFTDVGLIKLDCEGYEPYILRGAEQTIKKYRPVILMEEKNLSKKYYGTEGNLAVEILLSWGYTKEISWPKDCVMVYNDG